MRGRKTSRLTSVGLVKGNRVRLQCDQGDGAVPQEILWGGWEGRTFTFLGGQVPSAVAQWAILKKNR